LHASLHRIVASHRCIASLHRIVASNAYDNFYHFYERLRTVACLNAIERSQPAWMVPRKSRHSERGFQ
jgi:hypothetical protein